MKSNNSKNDNAPPITPKEKNLVKRWQQSSAHSQPQPRQEK